MSIQQSNLDVATRSGFLVATLLGMTGCGGSPDTIPTPVSPLLGESQRGPMMLSRQVEDPPRRVGGMLIETLPRCVYKRGRLGWGGVKSLRQDYVDRVLVP